MMARRARNIDGSLSEAAFQSQVVGLARMYGYLIFHAPAGGRGGRADREQLPEGRGFPDLLMVRGDRLIAAELKTDQGRIGPGQREWLAALAAAGAETFLWKPQDWDEIQETLRGSLDRRNDLDPLPAA